MQQPNNNNNNNNNNDDDDDDVKFPEGNGLDIEAKKGKTKMQN